MYIISRDESRLFTATNYPRNHGATRYRPIPNDRSKSGTVGLLPDKSTMKIDRRNGKLGTAEHRTVLYIVCTRIRTHAYSTIFPKHDAAGSL